MVEDQRQKITDEWIKNQLVDKRRYLLLYFLILSSILIIISIFLISSSNDTFLIVLSIGVLVFFVPTIIYDCFFYLYVIQGKHFYIIEDTLEDIKYDVIAFGARENGFDSALKHRLTFKKIKKVFVSAKSRNYKIGDTFFIVIPMWIIKNPIALYNTKCYSYKSN